MTEVLFYHLQRRPLEDVLPNLLERCLERGWRAVVQTRTQERCEALDTHLWCYRDDSFLPHGRASDRHAAAHPIWLTTTNENPNGAAVRFVVDRAACEASGEYQRIVHLFDGADAEAVEAARRDWKAASAAGHAVTYWQQDESGRWTKRA